MFWNQVRKFFRFSHKIPAHQAYPVVTPKDVERIIQRDFGAEAALAREILNNFSSKWPGEHAAIHVACLRLANGSPERLRKMVEAANSDWRDVLLWSHHPEENRRMGPYSKLSRAEEQAILARDWKQYQEWLDRE